MTVKNLTVAENELLYLKHNALFGIFWGLLVAGDFLYSLLKSFVVDGWVITSVGFLYVVAIVLFFVTLSKLSRYSSGISKRAFWYGNFTDEFSAFLNQQGYKSSFYTVTLVLTATWAFAGIDDFSAWFNAVVLRDYAGALICIAMWAYAVPVLLGLRAEHE